MTWQENPVLPTRRHPGLVTKPDKTLRTVTDVMKGKNRWPKPDPDSGVEDVTLLIMEWLGEQGVAPMLRVDVERMREGRRAWTFVASGGPLPCTIRIDGATAGACMDAAVHAMREAGLDVPF